MPGDLAYLAASNGTVICVGSVPPMRYNSPPDQDWWGIAQDIAPGSLVGLGGRRSAPGFSSRVCKWAVNAVSHFGDLLIDLIEFIQNLRNKQWLESGCPGPLSAMDSHTLKCKTAHCMNFS